MRRVLLTLAGMAVVTTMAFAALPQKELIAQSAATAPRASTAPPAAADLTQYCVTCHNAKLKTGGLVIDPAVLANVGMGADVWEKVVRKLRTSSMPPPGLPRPDEATYASVASFPESELERAWNARPVVGPVPRGHRVRRTEGHNA